MDSIVFEEHIDTTVQSLGKPSIESPVQGTTIFVDDSERVVIDTSLAFFNRCASGDAVPLSFELAGPRRRIFFDPSKTKCGIVTCGGLCPGINDVIRGIVLELFYAYHVENIYGIPYGLQGFIPAFRHPLTELTPASVEQIHELGGTVLGSSRGSQDISEMVDAMERLNMNIVFFIGGDGTLKASSAVAREALSRGFKCSVIA
ncbi:MAG TPA: 6-phosphofructokinase, partial [Desulfomonilia bacterium]|nr:6-phosphofructokinase [Desulfomonilia bacterium]